MCEHNGKAAIYKLEKEAVPVNDPNGTLTFATPQNCEGEKCG